MIMTIALAARRPPKAFFPAIRYYTSRRHVPHSLEQVPNPIPNVGFYRGGTSKGVFIHSRYLPDDRSLWPRVLGGIMGSPDIYKRQLNGLGGGISSLSKVVVVSPSAKDDIDCEYTFVQVGIEDDNLDFTGNCGNLSSMVGVFAMDSGICTARPEPDNRGRVRSFNTNTNKVIDTVFPLNQHQTANLELEEVEMAGVSGLGSKIDLHFLDPAGAKTGRLLPTGKPVDVLELPGDDLAEVSLVDATNPTVILPYHELRILLSLPPHAQVVFESDETLRVLENVRSIGAQRMGLEPASAQPKIVVVQPSNMHDHTGEDLVVRALSMGVPHKAIPMTVGLCVGVAAGIRNTVVERMIRGIEGRKSPNSVVLRHPGGTVEVGAVWTGDQLQSASVVRTGRRLMQGGVFW